MIGAGQVGRIGAPSRRRLWTPHGPGGLGSKLFEAWDAEHGPGLTLASGAVTTWASVRSGLAPTQGTAAARPAFSPTGLNGRPEVTFDGADELTVAGVGDLPIGTTPCEIWGLVRQPEPAASVVERTIFGYGGNSAGFWRRVNRTVSGGVNRAVLQQGNTGSAPLARNDNVDFSGVHLFCARFSNSIQTDVDGVAGAPVATGNPATTSTRTRFGARNDDAPTNFYIGGVNYLAVTQILVGQDRLDMIAFLARRGGIAI